MKSKFMYIFAVLVFVLAACSSAAPTAAPATEVPKPTTAPPPTAAPTQPPAPVAIPEIKIDAADFSYTAPETISAGWTRIILTNTGTEPHHVQFLRLNDGVTVQQVEDALKQAEGPALALTQQVGGVGAIHPGGTASAVLNLPAGEYVILCFIPSPADGVAHHAKGMVKSLIVNPAKGAVAAEPKADLTIHLKDFVYEMPNTLPTGPQTIQVINDGPEPHELNLLRLEEGKTLNDVIQFLNGAGGPPPFAPVGGMNGLDAGLKGYAEVNLAPGNYVAICNIPSPQHQGHPHFSLGMIREFTVGEPASSKFPSGTFVDAQNKLRGYVFNEDFTWKYFTLGTGSTAASGTYSVDGNHWVEAGGGGDNCQPATYEWSFDGTNLAFKLVGEDSCIARKASLDGHTFVLQK